MGLTLADLQEWDPEQIDELADAAAARARHSREAAENIANLPVFATWDGQASQTAKDALANSSTKMELSAQNAFQVWAGAGHAYQEASAVKKELHEAVTDSPGTGPGRAGEGLLNWLEDTKVPRFARINVVTAASMSVPAVSSDMHEGNSAAEAVTRESVGTGAGLWLGAMAGGAVSGGEIGAALGTVVPGAGTAAGLVVGAVVGGAISWGASKGVEAAWAPVTGAAKSAVHSVENFLGFG